jgi:hypothetical protein
MSTDFTAIACIGVKVHKDRLFEEVERAWCRHPIPVLPSGAKFCPECGKPVGRRVKEPIDGYSGEKLFGLTVIEAHNDADYVIVSPLNLIAGVGLGVARKANLKPVDLVQAFSATWQKLQDTLTPHGLWDENQFGLWAVLQY